MAHPTVDNVEEELQGQVLVWNHIFQFISSMSLKPVVELGIPDVLHRNEDRPICLSRLASLISIPPNRIDHLRRLMRMLVFTGDHRATETQLFLDMLMMVDVGGKEREEHEWNKIFTEAGFTTYKATYGTGLLSFIEVYP
ncbi:Trans-resveratrol di-O-methyltransferase [Acorus calamus]|uniref:Trans-resveratrol di-O-methyltransferase n=1 Tax=Acorus calamus TaxID=4465 RepID=A0AAV9DNU6_ACOCL|nr:Trans-resveratrol di-O-methyltransferase [Acorus calamus]